MLPTLPDFRVRQRDYLLEITRAITQELDLDKLLARILRISIEMLAGQAGLIALKKDDGWHVGSAQKIPPALLDYLKPLLAEETVSEFNINELNRMLKSLAYTASRGLLNGVGLPLLAHQQVIGVIFIFRNYSDTFSLNDKRLLRAFADQAASAVYNAQLYGQVTYEKQRLDALLESAADGILILNADHTIERVNSAFQKLYGQPREEITGKAHAEIIRWASDPHGATLEESESEGWPLTPNASLYVEGDLYRPDPPNLPVGVTYAPLFAADNSLRNIFISVRDITHFRTAEQVKSTFISVVSHELRTPVALIKGYASTLRRDDARWDRDVIEDSLMVIEEEADRLSKMIDDLLDASRLQAGGLSLNMNDISIQNLASQLADRFASQAGSRSINTAFPEHFPLISADETRIRQVLTNLISNAIKYAPKGDITISGEARPEQIILCVSDEGPGIDPKDMPHIFDRFYRASESVNKTKGAGLGLYLARAIIEAHNGRMWIDSKSTEGARICFSLPR
ncbi:MAG: PAS domain-containing protein [Anaerolineae bacterium]|jgi:PAS domain S-box-containing protein|nr:PAS domain-containing protein [Anaerolineae bacterium]MBT4311097.1 PAS domain-containing protein [Anaerolineae bacterium]MBT4459168.1 PAS domain-containing protein [Anaerolineae bacterium]MBT4841467.1 PAS domain-containing protein [Anaerolineae bacterium]MBT6323907.1 PAS domain-containing protein [Anaerolineae bacterium]